MNILALLVWLALVGVVAWALTKLPMPNEVRTVIVVVAVLLCVLIVLQALGGVSVPGLRITAS